MARPLRVTWVALFLVYLAVPSSGFLFQNDFWNRHFGFGPQGLLHQLEQGFQRMEQSAQREAQELSHSLKGLIDTKIESGVERDDSQVDISSEGADEDDDSDERPDDFGLGDGFFGVFGGNQRPWWKGPNVCVEREEIDESQHKNNTDDAEGTMFGSFQFSSCQQSSTKYICTTKMQSHGIRKTFIVKYQCCYGFQRVPGKPGCTEVDLKPMMETLDNVNAHDFMELIRTANLEDKVRNNNMTIFAPSDTAVRDFADNFQEANQVEFYVAPGKIQKRDAEKMENTNLRDIVLGHMVEGFYDMNDLVSKQVVHTDNKNATIRIGVYPVPGERLITANCARITSFNNYATNGIVHVVDRVIQPVTKSLADLLAEDEQFTVLKSMLAKSGMLEKLAGEGHWTLFAPTDSAFEKLDSTIQKRLQHAETCVKNVVSNHLVPVALCSSAIVSKATTTNMDGENIVLERHIEDGKLFVNDVQIVAKDIMATNGIIHVVDAVLMPDSAQPLTKVLASHNLTIFRDLLEDASLTESLDYMSNVTVFVPTDDALKKPEAAELLKKLQEDKDRLRDLLLFHTSGPSVPTCDMSNGQQLRSGLADHSLRVNLYTNWPFFVGGRYRTTVECARVIQHDNKACGGVVHEVDRLLIPPTQSVIETLEKRGNFSNFVKLIQKINLVSELKENSPFTILAPPDSVFKEMDQNDYDILMNDTEIASAVLRLHVIPDMACCAGIGETTWPFVNRIETLQGSKLKIGRDYRDEVHFGTTTVKECDIIATDGIIHIVNKIMVPMRRHNPNVDIFLYGYK